MTIIVRAKHRSVLHILSNKPYDEYKFAGSAWLRTKCGTSRPREDFIFYDNEKPTCKICLREDRTEERERNKLKQFTEGSKYYIENEQAELCKLNLWNDQIEFNLITCAECCFLDYKTIH